MRYEPSNTVIHALGCVEPPRLLSYAYWGKGGLHVVPKVRMCGT